MSPIKLAAIVCTTALLALVAAAIAFTCWPKAADPTAVTLPSQSAAPASSGNEERLQRAMTFTTPAEPGK